MTDRQTPAQSGPKWQAATIPEKDVADMRTYRTNENWGMSASIDVTGCDPSLISNADYITKFSRELVEYIDMEAYGQPMVVRFGDGNKEGYTLVQLIQTSSITAHFAEDTNSAYIDVFSCKPFPPGLTAKFCKEYFGGLDHRLLVNHRRPPALASMSSP